MKKPSDGYRFPIHLTVVSVFVVATLLTATIAIGLQFHFSRGMAIDSALARYQLAAAAAGDYLAAVDSEAGQASQLLAKFPELVRAGKLQPGARDMFAEVMRNNRLFYAIYVALPDGDFHELVNLDSSPIVRAQLQAAPDDRWVQITVTGQSISRRRRFQYFDADFNPRGSRSEYTAYDPTERPWFSGARADRVFKTAPYMFKHLQAPGQTYSTVIAETGAVLGVDITLDALSEYLRTLELGASAEVFLYQETGEVIASNRGRDTGASLPELPALALEDRLRAAVEGLGTIRVSNELDWPPIDYAVSGQPRGYAIELLQTLARMTGLEIEFINGYPWPEFLELFRNRRLEVLQPVFRNAENEKLGIMTRGFLDLPHAIVTTKDHAEVTRLDQLAERTLAIPSGWSIIPIIREHYPEIRILETVTTREALLAVSEGTADATIDVSVILHHTVNQYFMEGFRFHEDIVFTRGEFPRELTFVVRNELPELAEVLNVALAALDETFLEALAARWFGGPDGAVQSADQSTVPYRALMQRPGNGAGAGRMNEQIVGGEKRFVFVSRLDGDRPSRELFGVVVPETELLGPSLSRVKVSILITATCLLFLVPISWLFAVPIVRPIRRLAFENEKIKNRRFNEVAHLETSIVEVHDLSRSIVDMAEAIQQYERQQRELMESLIQLVARAIDEKSPYTAGHCARVPVLAIMLAEAASACDKPPFDGFRFNNDDEFREFKIAAWLHDCGKITTPEHIVDKGSKLETIYNRIHEIRMRFEVLWRDAEIDFLRQLQENPGEADRLETELSSRRRELQDDFQFIANTNVGGESLADEDIARIESLAGTTWERNFDDRLGLSPVEAMRVSGDARPLPAREPLLADRPEHIIVRTRDAEHDPGYGIRMDMPEHLYNLGEVYNLRVSRGTLNREDRFKIQEHMISTIKMLESLPFPPELSRVPRYASTHHETLRGDGYPRRLGADELSIPERIIAVADIFEALTAADRPYKDAKPVSESVEILHRMVEANHIDRNVFELFLTSGVYLEFARQHLDPGQIDEVDVKRYLKR